MSDTSRRPPSDDLPDGTVVNRGYLLDERLPDGEASRIAARLEAALAARGSRRRPLRVAAGIAAAAVFAAFALLFLRPRTSPLEAPADLEAAPMEIPREETRDASPPPARAPEPPPALRPTLPESDPARPAPPDRVPVEDRRPPATADLRPSVPEPATREIPAPSPVVSVVQSVVPEEVRTIHLSVRRTDDPRRPPILMTIRYRCPAPVTPEEKER